MFKASQPKGHSNRLYAIRKLLDHQSGNFHRFSREFA
jgi:hypothetical protein